jgi:putative ABC transport system substrate-binding protein
MTPITVVRADAHSSIRRSSARTAGRDMVVFSPEGARVPTLVAHMRRREFITLLGGGVMVAWPLAARAQQPSGMRRIGVLMAHAESDPEFKAYVAAFPAGLEKLGWTEGRNIRIDFRWGALDDAEARERSAKDLIALQPDLILTQNTPPTASMLKQTRTIPVVFVIVADPVGSGFVESLARPGGNATGFTIMEPTISSKWVELLKEIAPRVNRAAVLFNPATTPYADIYLNPFKVAAASFGLEAVAAPVHSVPDLEFVVAEWARTPNGGLIVIPDGFLNVHRAEIVSLAARHRVPAVYPWRFFPDIGGLLSYGSDQRDLFRFAATYVDRILKGAKPNDLPVQAPVKYELVINLNTAKALGLDVPLQLQQRADEVIE